MPDHNHVLPTQDYSHDLQMQDRRHDLRMQDLNQDQQARRFQLHMDGGCKWAVMEVDHLVDPVEVMVEVVEDHLMEATVDIPPVDQISQEEWGALQ